MSAQVPGFIAAVGGHAGALARFPARPLLRCGFPAWGTSASVLGWFVRGVTGPGLCKFFPPLSPFLTSDPDPRVFGGAQDDHLSLLCSSIRDRFQNF